jgi:glutamyl-tRNA synthetase
MDGTLILRIEDTNTELAKPEFYDAITEPLKWLGLKWDEGPFYQSQRVEKYLNAIKRLLDESLAYCCDCSRESIEARNKTKGFKGGYDGHCRDREIRDGPNVTIRFKTPKNQTVEIKDSIRGNVTFDTNELEDFIIRRSNGTPVFLVANTVDDADMQITHVIRGEDLLNTTPKILLMWEALGYGPSPQYAHLPLLVGEDKKKLSKRKHSVALGEFKTMGILPESMVNYLALLGWGPNDDKEIRPIEEIISLFSLEDINKALAYFDMKKLYHINAEYIRALPPEMFVSTVIEYFQLIKWEPAYLTPKVLHDLASSIQERIEKLADVPKLVDWLFDDEFPAETDEKEIKKITKAMSLDKVTDVLDLAVEELEKCTWNETTIGETINGIGHTLETKSQVPIRIAVTGRRVGLPLFKPMEILGRQKVLERLREARAGLG